MRHLISHPGWMAYLLVIILNTRDELKTWSGQEQRDKTLKFTKALHAVSWELKAYAATSVQDQPVVDGGAVGRHVEEEEDQSDEEDELGADEKLAHWQVSPFLYIITWCSLLALNHDRHKLLRPASRTILALQSAPRPSSDSAGSAGACRQPTND